MTQEQIGQLMDRWVNDDAFRSALRKNPEVVIRAAGMNLTDEEKAAIQKIDWNLPDEDLKARINKAA